MRYLLRDRYAEKTARSREKMSEAFRFENTLPPVHIIEGPCWLFGELPEEIPENYCSADYMQMLDHQVKRIVRHQDAFPNDCLEPFVMPWYGTGVLASGFGAEIVYKPGMDPAVNMSTVSDPSFIDTLEPPDPNRDGMMPMVLECIDTFRENCDLPISVTDCQGPFTTALSIIGYENYMYWMMQRPEKVHRLMELVTDALIHWVKVQKDHMGVPYTEPGYQMCVRVADGCGGVIFSDDDSVIMSPRRYAEFVKPYNEKLLQAFGGGCIHCCGRIKHLVNELADTKGLTMYHNMTLDNLNNAAINRRAFAEKGIPFVVGDFTVSDARLPSYFEELFTKLAPLQGLIVASYIAPAVALDKGKYEAARRDPAELARRVEKMIDTQLNRIEKGEVSGAGPA